MASSPGAAFAVSLRLETSKERSTRLSLEQSNDALRTLAATDVQPPRPEVNSTEISPVIPGTLRQTTSSLEGASRYFEKGELDEPATLVGEWYVQSELWASTTRSVQVRLWISAHGDLEQWMLLSPTGDARVQESLQYMDRTILNPAKRNGLPVSSVMDVELMLGDG